MVNSFETIYAAVLGSGCCDSTIIGIEIGELDDVWFVWNEYTSGEKDEILNRSACSMPEISWSSFSISDLEF